MVMGHEAAGTIAAVGANVTKLKVGDRVALEPGFPCRRCPFCLDGRYNLCPDMAFAASPGPGPVAHGTLSTFFPLPEDFCYKLPEQVGLDEGVLMEPLAVAVHATRLVGIKPGQDIVVFGAGTVGILAAAVAREFGVAKIIVVDVNAERLKFAQSFAATHTYRVDTTLDPVQNAINLREQSGLLAGADIIIEITGVASSVQAGIQLIKKGGAYVQVGLGKPTIDFPLVLMSEKEITMKGCFRYSAGDFALASNLLARGRINVKALITKVVSFDRATEAWETARQGLGIKTLIRVGNTVDPVNSMD